MGKPRLGGLRGCPRLHSQGGVYQNSGLIPAPQGLLRPHLEHMPAAPQDPFQSPSRQAALHLHASWLVSEPSATAPQSSRNVCVHRCLWRCVHVSYFAFPFSSWQALHFQSTHWVNFSRFKTIASKCSAPGSCRGSGHGASGIVWLSWHLCKLP